MNAIVLMMLVLVLASVLCSKASEIIPGDFVFPIEKSTSLLCTFQNGTSGRCMNASQCPKVHEELVNGVNPTLCYFARNEPIVCCVTEPMKAELISALSQSHDPEPLKMNQTVVENKIETTTLRPLSDLWDLATEPGFIIIQNPDVQNVKPTVPSKPSQQLVKRRKSVARCEDVYSKAVPFEPGTFHITIVGGQVTAEGEFPHMAALGWTNEENQTYWRCGGTLISHDYVMTAAHCVRTPPDTIRLGAKDLSTSSTSQDFGIEKIIPHPEYQEIQLYHDIALIKLNKQAKITKKVRPACLCQGNPINFTDATATGYGHTSFGGQSSDALLKADLKVFSNDECAEGYKSERKLRKGIVESQLCAGDSTGEKDTCQGDSGGPIQVSTKNNRQIVYHILGVTSFGKACASTLPGVYTRVSHYLDWIESIVWD